jgi:hypothetical protein
MPSLFRFLCLAAALGGMMWLCLWALATFIEPPSRTITVNVPVNLEQP